jgi:hypothetical protein
MRPLIPAAVSRTHPLIDTVHSAFSEHRPLSLSPDAIWLVIAQGFSHHVAENAERLRGRLVRHQGKRTLEEEVGGLTLATFGSAIAGFSGQIREASDPVLHETLICDFSTTTPEILTASEVVLMDTYASYFDYTLHCVCGIPSITVTGTLADWERIRARVEVLATYDLEWWMKRLRPILDEFVNTAAGRVSLDFWRAIFKPKKVYAAEAVTGWLADLFPYLGDPPRRVQNHCFRYQRTDWAIPPGDGWQSNGVSTNRFPSGLSKADLKLTFPDGREDKCDLVAGFLGAQQDAGSLELSPLISWAVAEPAPQKAIVLD